MKLYATFFLLLVILINTSTYSKTYDNRAKERISKIIKKMKGRKKGPFSKNFYQGVGGRARVGSSLGNVRRAPQKIRPILFTSAFRNKYSEELAKDYHIYTGNLFTTNYYELYGQSHLVTGRQVRKNAFPINMDKFNSQSQLLPKAQYILIQMMMEQFFTRENPSHFLATSRLIRGISGIEDESQYFEYFCQYFAAQIKNDRDYFLLYELIRRYDLNGQDQEEETDIKELRDKVSILAAKIMEWQGKNSSMYGRFFAIRNKVHNQLDSDVLKRFAEFDKRYKESMRQAPFYRLYQTFHTKLIRYFEIDLKKLTHTAKKLYPILPKEIIRFFNEIKGRPLDPETLYELSQTAVELRAFFFEERNPKIVQLVKKIQDFSGQIQANFNKEEKLSPLLLKSSLSLAYAQGLINHKIFTQAKEEIDTQNFQSEQLETPIWSADQTLRKTFTDGIETWTIFSSKMKGFIDDTLRSSGMNAYANTLQKIKEEQSSVSHPNDSEFTIMNKGTCYGYLTYLDKNDILTETESYKELNKKSLPIFEILPLDLTVVAGIITIEGQTPLSHVNIKSKARGTPNLVYPKIMNNSRLQKLIKNNALVSMTLKNGKVSIQKATLAEAQDFWSGTSRPTQVRLFSDLEETRIRSTTQVRSSDVHTIGAKAANYGELQKVLGPRVVLEGITIPFYYYQQFLEENGIDQKIEAFLSHPSLSKDRVIEIAELKKIKKSYKKGVVNPSLINAISEKLNLMYPNRKMRFRSSTNSEDLPQFSGAGLYDSTSYLPGDQKKTIARALKKIWASVWNLRAFDERNFFNISHRDVYVGILVNPAFPQEEANGVVVTRNIVQTNGKNGFYLNLQIGEESVTNPSGTTRPEEILIYPQENGFSVDFIKYSTLSPNLPILQVKEYQTLGLYLQKAHDHFKKVMDPDNLDPSFSLDLEFKVDDFSGQRRVYFKQARPYVQ